MSNPVTHKVVSGDTLFSLGKKYGLTVAELKSINNLTSDTIKVGQILKLTPFTHTVVSGDTLFSLAKKHNTTVDTLKSLNGLKSDMIKVGQILRLPEYNGQLQLKISNTDIFLENINYELKLADGSIHSGVTDNSGCTNQITCNKKDELEVIEIKIPALELSCCEPNTILASNSDFILLSNHEPTTKKIGSNAELLKLSAKVIWYTQVSKPVITASTNLIKDAVIALSIFDDSRELHPNERKKLFPIFGNGIDYDKVRIADNAIF